MADDIKIKLGLDASEVFSGISKATTELNKLSVSADKTDATLSKLENQKIDIDTAPAESALNQLDNQAKGLGAQLKDSFNMQNLSAGLAGGLAGGLASGGIQTIISGVQSIGSNIFNAAMQADEFGDTLEVAFTQQGIADVDAEIEKVSKSTRQLADDLGLPTQRTRELATTVATMGGVSGKQAEELTKLSAGLETFSGGAVRGEAVALAFSKGLADPEGAAAIEKLAKKYPQLAETLRSNIEPAEKMKVANELLGQSFATVAQQQSDAGGSFNKFSNALNAAYESIGTGIMDAINMIIPIFTETLGPIFSQLGDTIGAVFERISSVVQPILAVIGGVIIANIVNSINLAMNVVNTFYQLWIYAFDQVMAIIQPLIDEIKAAFGIDGAMGEGIDVMEIFQQALNAFSAVLSAVFKVVQDVGKVIIDILVGSIKTAIEFTKNIVIEIGNFIRWIGDLVSKIPGVQSVFQGLQSAFNGVKSFFQELPAIINQPTAYLKALGATFQTVFGILQDAFNKALNLDFSGAAQRLSDVFDASKWSASFSANLQKAKAELKSTQTQIQITGQELNNLGGGKGGGGKGGGGKGGGAGQEALSELETLKKAFQEEQDELDRQAFFKLEAAKKEGKDLQAVQAQIDAENKAKLKLFLNDRLAEVKDANIVLSQEQITSIIKPSAKKGETVGDVTDFYIDAIAKLNKGGALKVDTGIKVKPEEFKEFLKEYDDLAKEIDKTTENLVPKTLATSQEALDGTIASVQQYIDFIKSQNDEIALKQAEAISAGNEEAAAKFGESIQSNIQNINTLSSRLKRFTEESSAELAKSTGLSGAILTLQSALNDAFNIEKIRKERETNEQIRQERLNALNDEEDDLMGSLAKREISFDEYQTKLAKIAEDRQAAMEDTETTFMERMKGVLDQTVGNLLKGQSSAISGYVEDQFKNTEGKVSETGKIIGNLMGNLATQFGELALSGKATLADFARSSVLVAYQALQQMIPIFIAEIAGKQFAELGLLGLASAAALTIALNGLFALAAPSLGFKDGVVELNGPGTETSDSIPAWLSKGESVITAAGTRANKEELAWMNANPGMSIRDYFASQAPQVRYSVTEDGSLIQEVRKLREETRGLGKQITRNTKVEVRGALIADNNSIKAVIEADRRRNARRG